MNCTGQGTCLKEKPMSFFSMLQDGRILAWKFRAVGNCFEPAASLSSHQLAVVSLVVGSMRLYSGSMDHTIKVRFFMIFPSVYILFEM